MGTVSKWFAYEYCVPKSHVQSWMKAKQQTGKKKKKVIKVAQKAISQYIP